MNRLTQQAVYTTKGKIIEISEFVSSRLYVWQKEIVERKKRAPQVYAEEVDAALNNIVAYPYMGGKKGALMLAYQQLEYIGQRSYDFVKKLVKVIIYAEIKHRNLERTKPQWTKIVAKSYGEIWCADFTHVELYGRIIYIAVVLDDYSHYYLGYNVSAAADFQLVDGAFKMALETCQGVLPEICMVNDRGSQYKAELYKEHVKKYGIDQIFIPKGTPWNNGEAEVGMKDIQALIYQSLSHTRRKRGQDIVEVAQEMAQEVFKELNDKIPRLKLAGVTPADVVEKRAEAKRASTQAFIGERIAHRPKKKRIDDLNQYINQKLDLNKWSDRSLKNLVYLINRKYKLIVPAKGVG